MAENTQKEPITIKVCQGTGCVSVLSPAIRQKLEEEAEGAGLSAKVKVDWTGCHGVCQQGPVVIIEPEGILYTHVKETDAKEIIEKIKDNQYVERLFYKDLDTGDPIPHYQDIPFYKHQMKVVLRNCGKINPDKIEA
jgi:(2Fe-2S) ferredoxin